MKVENIVKMVCDFVGEKEIFDKLAAKEQQQLSPREQEKVDKMVRCFNLVNQEIAADFLPFLTEEEVEERSLIEFSSLKKKIVNVYEVKNRFGMNLRYKLYPTHLQIAGKAKWIVYSFLPEELALDDEVEMLCGLSARVYAYGIASEYLLTEGISDDADIWETRYKQSLFMLSRKRGNHLLPPRRDWF